MARGNTIGQLCLLLLVSCSSLLFMQYPACATAALSAQQAQPAAAAAAASAAALQALNTLKRVSLAGNPMVNSRAFGAVQDSRNWNTLATKLTKPGASIKIAVFGTSLTQGYHVTSGFPETWAHEVQRWLEKAFPSATVELINLARDASDVTPAAVCWYQRVPATADLIILDFALGGCGNMQCVGIGAEQIANFESLLRRLMRKAPSAAFLLLENFVFKALAPKGEAPSTPLPYYHTGGDMQWLLARRYRVPVVSVRDALYDMMFDDNAMKAALGLTRSQFMADHIHPSTTGHNIIGQGMVAYALRSTLQQELSRIAAGSGAATASTRPRLPSPVSPLAALEADGDTFCAEGRDLEKYVDQSTIRAGSWKWTNSAMGSDDDNKACAAAKAALGNRVNCGNWGLSTTGFAKYLDFHIDTRNIPGNNTVASVASNSRLDKRQLMFIYDRAMADGAKVGTSGELPTALVQCVSGCTCSAFEIGGDDVTYSELTATGKSEVSAHPRCVVRLSILEKGPRSNDYFKVNGIVVVPYSQPYPFNSMDSAALARESLFNDVYGGGLAPKHMS